VATKGEGTRVTAEELVQTAADAAIVEGSELLGRLPQRCGIAASGPLRYAVEGFAGQQQVLEEDKQSLCRGDPRSPILRGQIVTEDYLLTAAQSSLSSLQIQPGLCEEGTDQMRLLPQTPDSEVEFLVQLVQVPAHEVAQLDLLQMMPPALIPGVQRSSRF
jgi:hypothetical protein